MIQKPVTILNRDHEWQSLVRRWESQRPELVFVVGRRRVGKSHLLAPFARQVNGLYYQATRRTEAEQLAALSRVAGMTYDDPALVEGQGFADWPSFLRYVERRTGGDPALVVLDEYPYLEDASPGLASILQAAWDHELTRAPVMLVLAGSHVSAMARLEAADQPLHARRTARIQVRPLTYFDAARFFPGYSPRRRLEAYAIFGGVPGNLGLIDPGRDLAENVIAEMLDPTARLFDEAEQILDPFLGDAYVHYSILAAIARGEATWSGITKRVGRSSGSLSRPLRWLLDMGYVQRDEPITVRGGRRGKRALYRIDDPYIVFWHRFIAPLRRDGLPTTMTPPRLFEQVVEPGLADHMGPIFEAVCRDFLRHSERLPFLPMRVGRWWNHDASEEVDAVALGDGEILVAECKWGRVDAGDLEKLKRRSRWVATELGGQPRVHLALFTGSEVDDPEIHEAAEQSRVRLYQPRDIFVDLGP